MAANSDIATPSSPSPSTVVPHCEKKPKPKWRGWVELTEEEFKLAEQKKAEEWAVLSGFEGLGRSRRRKKAVDDGAGGEAENQSEDDDWTPAKKARKAVKGSASKRGMAGGHDRRSRGKGSRSRTGIRKRSVEEEEDSESGPSIKRESKRSRLSKEPNATPSPDSAPLPFNLKVKYPRSAQSDTNKTPAKNRISQPRSSPAKKILKEERWSSYVPIASSSDEDEVGEDEEKNGDDAGQDSGLEMGGGGIKASGGDNSRTPVAQPTAALKDPAAEHKAHGEEPIHAFNEDDDEAVAIDHVLMATAISRAIMTSHPSALKENEMEDAGSRLEDGDNEGGSIRHGAEHVERDPPWIDDGCMGPMIDHGQGSVATEAEDQRPDKIVANSSIREINFDSSANHTDRCDGSASPTRPNNMACPHSPNETSEGSSSTTGRAAIDQSDLGDPHSNDPEPTEDEIRAFIDAALMDATLCFDDADEEDGSENIVGDAE